ncbi:MAG: hypothetical protein IPI38_00215 [Gemmatimonadetes bacterium]|nr:hypothetical protein [Gemmatimonadota bacterium]
MAMAGALEAQLTGTPAAVPPVVRGLAVSCMLSPTCRSLRPGATEMLSTRGVGIGTGIGVVAASTTCRVLAGGTGLVGGGGTCRRISLVLPFRARATSCRRTGSSWVRA